MPGFAKAVALRKESVDRNAAKWAVGAAARLVALRKESVDRNCYAVFCGLTGGAALRKESVDRNIRQQMVDAVKPMSLSARRAWIEIVGLELTSGLI